MTRTASRQQLQLYIGTQQQSPQTEETNSSKTQIEGKYSFQGEENLTKKKQDGETKHKGKLT